MNKLELEDYFRKLRWDKSHHLGLGDIRLTIGQQEQLVESLFQSEEIGLSGLDAASSPSISTKEKL